MITTKSSSSIGSRRLDSWTRTSILRQPCTVVAAFLLLSGAMAAGSQPLPGTLEVHWNEGAQHCKPSTLPPLQVHAYNPDTFIIRQNPCADFEANFLYLLIGANRALLIDTGAFGSASKMPLADTVLQLLPKHGSGGLPLLVVHTHKHDHRAGSSSTFQGSRW